MKNSSDTIGNRTRDLPACRAVPLQLRHRVPPLFFFGSRNSAEIDGFLLRTVLHCMICSQQQIEVNFQLDHEWCELSSWVCRGAKIQGWPSSWCSPSRTGCMPLEEPFAMMTTSNPSSYLGDDSRW